MATVANKVTPIGTTTQATTYTTGAFTPSASELLVVYVQLSNNTTQPTSVTGSANSITFTYTGRSQLMGGGADAGWLYIANQLTPASPVSMTVTANVATNGGGIVFVAGVTGMTAVGTAAIRQTAGQSNVAASGTPTATFGAACLTTNPVLAFFGTEATSGTTNITQPTGWTEGGDVGYITPINGGEYAWINSGFTNTVVTWGSTSSIYMTMAMELDATPAASPARLRVLSQAVNRAAVI